MGTVHHTLAFDWLLLLLPLALALGAGGYAVHLRRRRQERDAAALEEALARAPAAVATLHPVIDDAKCLGCTSCMAACPEGDIIGLVDGRARLLDPGACIGHGRCALECPVGAIRLVFGSAERGVDLPALGDGFETSRPGVHVVGELGGMGLIKNAVTQGLQAARALKGRVKGRPLPGQVDVLIVGAGPAGLATAAGLKDQGLTARLVDQEPAFGGTVAHYPRQKIVMTETVEVPGYGPFGEAELSKEELLELFRDLMRVKGLTVETGVRVEGIDGEDGDFTVQTTKGPMRARKVVLATGRRGTPRRLGVPGEDLPKVAYRLIDAAQYRGKRVLVVGGGDSAVEAALQLAAVPGTQVALAHRGRRLSARAANQRRLSLEVEARRLTALFSTTVAAIGPRDVTLSARGKKARLANDFVLVCAGGELPLQFLERTGVEVGRYFGGVAPAAAEADAGAKERRGRFAWVLAGVAALVLLVLAVAGYDYYLLGKAARAAHPLHKLLKPSGAWGHGVGIVATLLILSNFAYSVRKRVRALKGAAPIGRWLTFHQFAGTLGPLMVLFHAAFKTNNVLATLTSVTLGLLVLTGLLGRFAYGLLPLKGAQLDEVERRWARMRGRVEALMRHLTDALDVQGLLAGVSAAPVAPGDGLLALRRLPAEWLEARRQLIRIKPLLRGAGDDETFCLAYERLWRLRMQARFFAALKRAFSVWRLVHVVLAIALVLLVLAHVAVSLALGYHWVAS